jgi:hypothetical protein
MRPGDLVKITFAGHWLIGKTVLVVGVVDEGMRKGWLTILVDGKTLKVPDAWVTNETG